MATTHPILGCLAEVAASLKDVAGVDPMFMDTRDKQDALLELARVQARIAELKLRVLVAASDVAEEHGRRDAAVWLAHETRADPPEVRREARLAAALTRCPVLAGALAAGDVSIAQAHVIARALDDLPTDVDPETRDRAERHLVEAAGEFGPKELRVLGRRVLDHVAPEVGEEQERKLLEAEEAHAERRTWLTTRDAGDGTTYLKGRLPTPVVGRLLTYLHAYTNPRRRTTDQPDTDNGSGPGRSGGVETPTDNPGKSDGSSGVAGVREPYSVQLGKALCSFLEHTDPTQHPVHGGRATTVMVTVDLDTLLSGLGVATTSTGPVITAAEARRLACTADLVPAVFGGKSEILDQGRAKRLFQPPQRRAMELRDQQCRAEGCDVPGAWCEAHHLHPWSKGGRTDLADGILLCPHHHHRAHDARYDMTELPDGNYRFHRRT